MKNRGYYDEFGGAYLPEILVATFDELETTFRFARQDPTFWEEYSRMMSNYSCRPTPLTFAPNLTTTLGGARIYIKREDLNHTGAHKINHCLGQAVLAKHMGKTKVLAETGAGQHGVALATACAMVGIECEIHMGEIDIAK
jgi:tryptophan synthase beta chain